jgi:hypothetical protein
VKRSLSQQQWESLERLLTCLIDQEQARGIVAASEPEYGYWFGGGNIAEDEDGVLWLSGRYRSAGDARTGLAEGARGFELALFRSQDGGQQFEKVRSWTKNDLSLKGRVVSFEGSALMRRADGSWELFISMEKDMRYPEPYEVYQKSGTGVWQIDRLHGDHPSTLDAHTLEEVLVNRDLPAYLHVKDPYIIANNDGETVLGFCSHPISWASSNSGYARRQGNGPFEVEAWELVARGPIWDVASTRITGVLAVPQVGVFADAPPLSVYFYDGAECLRQLDEHTDAYTRPRGYSCEELGGALVGWHDEFPAMARLSLVAPMFLSPWGTRSSRYVSILQQEQGIRAIWQQSQQNRSQSLVTNFLPMDEVARLLRG